MSFTAYTDATLFQAVNQAESTLSAGIDASQVTIPLVSAAQFQSTGGYAWIVSAGNEELIKYTGKSSNDLTGVTRAQGGTSASSALLGDAVEFRISAEMHNAHTNAIKNITSELGDLSNGTRPLEALLIEDESGTVANGLHISIDTDDGSTILNFDLEGIGASVLIKGGLATAQVDIADLAMDGSVASWAFDEWKLYTGGDLGVGAGLGVHLKPGQADGSGVVAFLFESTVDLANTNATVLKVVSDGTTALDVRKVQTRAPKFAATASEIGLNLPVITSALGGLVVDGDVYLTNILGVRKLNAKIGGTVYSVTLT